MLISIIIPCYNTAPYINRCLKSVFEQTYTDFEIILINDGSTDNLEEELEKGNWLASPQLQYHSQSNAGANHARNKGIELANGEFLQFLDADDLLMPDKLVSSLEIINRKPEIEVVIGAYETINSKGEVVKTFIPDIHANSWISLMNSCMGITSANLWKKEAVTKAGGWNTALKSSQEYDLLFRILKNGGKVDYNTEIHTIITQREGSISNSNQGMNWSRFVDLRVKVLHYLEQHSGLADLNEARNSLFSCVRNLYAHDKEKATAIYNQNLRGKFKITQSANTSSSYRMLYKLLGFQMAEKIKRII